MAVLAVSTLIALDSIAADKRPSDLLQPPSQRLSDHRAPLDIEHLQFGQYAVRTAYAGPPARVILTTPEARMFRTRLREAARQPADFAGENVLAYWGCGTDCIQGAAVNLRTGHVVFLPGSICCWMGDEDEGGKLEYRLDGRLLIARGRIIDFQVQQRSVTAEPVHLALDRGSAMAKASFA